MESAVPIDDQPISAGFFDEGKWLSDYITPNEPDILLLWSQVAQLSDTKEGRVTAAWDWVANQVRYTSFVSAQINVEGVRSTQDDYWQSPSMVTKTRIGNCANKAILLTSLLRNELSPDDVYCILGNLHNGKVEGHAWVQVNLGGKEYVVESTRGDVSMLPVEEAGRYEVVHYFNDQKVLAVPGRTVMVPFAACYSNWLRDYLQWSYIND